MSLDIGTLVAKVKVDDSDFDRKTSGWSGKGAAVASAFGNIAADAIGQATSMLVDFVGEAAVASDNTAKFAKTLEFAGVDGKRIKDLKDITQDYADSTVYNLGDIQSITAQLASNGVEGYDSLAMALGNLNAVAGGNSETFGRVGSVLTQTAGQGKLTTENWNQLADAIPGASGVLQEALKKNGAFTGNFRKAMEEGQITAEEFNTAIQQVGSDPVAVEAAKSVETFEGAQGNLAAAIQSQLVVALDMLKPAFTGIQNALAWFIGNSGLLVPLITGIGVALLVVLGPAIWAAVAATWAWTAALLANPMTWIVLAIVALVAAIVWLIQNWDTAVAWISEVWSGFLTWFTEVVDGFVAWWNEVWGAVGSFFTGLWDGIVAWVNEVWSGFISWIEGVIAGFVSWVSENWGLLLSFIIGPIGLAIQWLVENWGGVMDWFEGVIDGFVGFWSDVWNTVKDAVVDIWEGIIDWFESIPDKINEVFANAGMWLYSIGQDIINGLWNGLKDIAGGITGWFEDTFGGIIDTVAGIFDINSPSRVFRYYIAGSIGEGMVKGLHEQEAPIDRAMRRLVSVPPVSWGGTGSAGATGASVTNVLNYQAAEGQSLESEEALYLALGGPRSPFGGGGVS